MALTACGDAAMTSGGAPGAVVRSLSGTEGPHGHESADLRRAIATVVEQGDGVAAPHVAAFYSARDHEPAWLDREGQQAAEVLLEEAAAADAHGLAPQEYDAERLLQGLRSSHDDADAAAAFDVSVTEALARLALHVAFGAEATREQERVRDVDVAGWLAGARETAGSDALQAIMPRHPEYAALLEAFARYREIARAGGWPSLPDDLVLRPGDAVTEEVHERLRRRLQVTGDLDEPVAPTAAPTRNAGDAASPETADAAAEPTYDETLVAGVRLAQARHGLPDDGIVGPQTVEALNVSVEDRLTQIALNMDRWRRLPDDLGRRHVRVNIPDFSLAVVEDGRDRLTMRVIAGEPEYQTPIFSDRISYLEFRPFWNVPDSIAHREILPRVQEDPDYLRTHRYEVLEDWNGPAVEFDAEAFDWEHESFEYRLRQAPGPHNALGHVKFMFPNQHAVYLHDTSSPGLFDRHMRALSNGCIRVEDPVELAYVLLAGEGDDEWTRKRIREAMQSGEAVPEVVRLSEPVPVHLMYLTAWVREDGQVEFRPDVYGRDARAGERPGQ
jgi:L,D-transpeptidase YcbB